MLSLVCIMVTALFKKKQTCFHETIILLRILFLSVISVKLLKLNNPCNIKLL